MKRFFERLSRRTWIIIGVIAIILLVIVIASLGGGNEPVFQTTAVERGDLAATVGATGTVRSAQSAVLLWQTNGVVESVDAAVGDRVKRDQVLASLDEQSLSQSIILAEADLAAAQKALEDLTNSGTATAQAARALDAAEEAYQKAYNYRMELNGKITITETYFDGGIPKTRTYRGYASAENIKDADEKLALAQAQLEDAQRTYDRVKDGPDAADVAAAEARVAAAQATLNLARIIAPFDGTVTQASAVTGDQVNAGTTAFRVDDLSSLLVDVQVSEVDINNVQTGQDAILTFDAVLGREYHGTVVQVGQAGDVVQGVVNFTVTVQLTDADELVKPGMTAAVSITVEEVKGALLIPNRAVRLIDGERVIYLLQDGQPVQVKIRLGSSSDTQSVLIDGEVNEGDLIILNPPAFNGPFGG